MDYKVFVVVREDENDQVVSWWNGATFVGLNEAPEVYPKQSLNEAYRVSAKFQAEPDYEIRIAQGKLSIDIPTTQIAPITTDEPAPTTRTRQSS